jgi:hypothetical protein
VKQRSLVSVSDRQFKKEQLKFAKFFRELMAQKYGEEFNPHPLASIPPSVVISLRSSRRLPPQAAQVNSCPKEGKKVIVSSG